METINGYKPLIPFTSAGAGTACWTIASKGGKEYFLKRFNSPKYMPACIELCKKYEQKKTALYNKLRTINNGNIVIIEDFFRVNTFYYIATQSIHEDSVTAAQVHLLPMEKILIIMKVFVDCMVQLERNGIVHADLKPDNIMIKPTVGGFYTLKLIDFDSSFFVSDPPADKEDLEGDATYLSPEVLMGMCGVEVELSSKLDVFAAGIMFHQFLSNELPEFDHSSFDSVCEAVANGAKPIVNESIDPIYQKLIESMLEFDPAKRPSFEEIFVLMTGGGIKKRDAVGK